MKFRNALTIIVLKILLQLSNAAFGQEEEEAVPLASLVPHIEQKHFKLKSSGQQYSLLIELPGGSRRNENVELRAPNTPEEELHVVGETRYFYPSATLLITYDAGKDGYRVKYNYTTFSIDFESLGADTLKSLGG